MQFSATRTPFAPPVRFGRQPAGVPDPHMARATARRTAQLAEAAAVVDVLPAPGESLHALMTGRYDLLTLAVAIIGKLGPVSDLHIATLAYSRRNLDEMVRQMDEGVIKRLTVLTSLFWKDHNKDLWDASIEAFRSRGQRIGAARNHCKVICFGFQSGTRLALEGSPNLRSNSNREQLALFNDAGLYDSVLSVNSSQYDNSDRRYP